MKYSFYTPIAYDYKFAFASIISYYEIADEILLGIDADKISWSELKFDFNENEFKETIKNIDKDKKVKYIEDNFHSNKSPIYNDTFERNFISKLCKKDNYIIGIDSDEILLNPKEFKEWLTQLKNVNLDIVALLFSVYKSFNEKLLITEPEEYSCIGTNLKDKYFKCRITGNKRIRSPLKILHYSWGRTENEILQKLKNWGHSKEFNITKYMNTWKLITLDNYSEFKNLHPLRLTQWWKSLKLMDLKDFNLSEILLEEIKKWRSNA